MPINTHHIGTSTASLMNPGLGGAQKSHRPDPAQFSDALFAKLDADMQGFFEVGDLEAAFQQLGAGAKGLQADDVFGQLDTDSDGKITQDELSTSLQKIAEQLESQFNAMRMHGMEAMHGLHGRPEGKSDKQNGLSQEELASLVASIESDEESDAANPRADLLNNLISNFDAADRNGDGRISAGEARAFQANGENPVAVAPSNGQGKSTQNASGEATVMRQVMELMRTYANPAETSAAALTSGFSAEA